MNRNIVACHADLDGLYCAGMLDRWMHNLVTALVTA